jgi:hypothetical protein
MESVILEKHLNCGLYTKGKQPWDFARKLHKDTKTTAHGIVP